MLTDEELDSMRSTLNESLPDVADVMRSTATSDGRGGQALAWTAVASVPCRIAPDTTRSETIVNDRVSNIERWMLTLPAGTNVAPADRIIVNARTFEVSAVRSSRSFEVSCRVITVEVL